MVLATSWTSSRGSDSVDWQPGDLVDNRLMQLCQFLRKCQEADDSQNIHVGGQPRSGKSSLAIAMALNIDPEFTVDYNIIYRTKDLGKKIYSDRGRCFVIDEAIFNAYNRDSMTSLARWLVKLFTVSAEMNHIVILILPRWINLDKDIKEMISWIIWARKDYTAEGPNRGRYSLYDATYFSIFDEMEYPQHDHDGIFYRLPDKLFDEYAQMKHENARDQLGIDHSNRPAIHGMSKMEVARQLYTDPRIDVSKAELRQLFGTVVYKLKDLEDYRGTKYMAWQ